MIDLHCHTTASDGKLSPAQLVELAKSRGVEVIAVTDHDTIDGIAEAQRAAESTPVRVVPGIELSSRFEDHNPHVLGYFLDPQATELAEVIESLRSDRFIRGERMVERLRELGYDLTMDDVRAQAGPSKVIVRPHIARALVAKDYVASVRDAFTSDLIADGGRADVRKVALPVEEAVSLIRRCGGAAVIAHPAVGHHEGEATQIPYAMLEMLQAHGLSGIEVEHPDQPPLVRDDLRAVADHLGLIETGGSDFHGDPSHVLGSFSTTPENFEKLEALARGKIA